MSPEDLGISASLYDTIQGTLEVDESLVWADRPSLRLYWKTFRWLLSLHLFASCLMLALGYLWWEPLAYVGLSILCNLIWVFLCWVAGRGTWYALTTRRVIIHTAWFWGLGSKNRSIDASWVGEMRVLGSLIAWVRPGEPVAYAHLYCVDQSEAVADLIRRNSRPPGVACHTLSETKMPFGGRHPASSPDLATNSFCNSSTTLLHQGILLVKILVSEGCDLPGPPLLPQTLSLSSGAS